MSIDFLLCQSYDRRHNNCLNFAAVAWEALTGDTSLSAVKEGDFATMRGALRGLMQVDGPTDEPTVCLMSTYTGEEHIGVCYKHRLLHLHGDGAQNIMMDVAKIAFKDMRFYRCR